MSAAGFRMRAGIDLSELALSEPEDCRVPELDDVGPTYADITAGVHQITRCCRACRVVSELNGYDVDEERCPACGFESLYRWSAGTLQITNAWFSEFVDDAE